MYECLSKKPDLIILDDPISSFDKNKKYAILEMLFRRDADSCLKSKTVLMLTHDVEPIIDTIRSLEKQFSNQTSSAFLKLAAGQICESAIGKDDIQTFSQICKSAFASEKHDLIKLVYMRRHYEIADNKGDAYQVLSNVFKKRERAIDTREPKGSDGKHPEMESAKFTNGCAEISHSLNGFSYPDLLNHVIKPFQLAACWLCNRSLQAVLVERTAKGRFAAFVTGLYLVQSLGKACTRKQGSEHPARCFHAVLTER